MFCNEFEYFELLINVFGNVLFEMGFESCVNVFVGVVSEEERFDFCMCNLFFFLSLEEVGVNFCMLCGGIEVEMVCLGGEEVFVVWIIEDSV